MEADDDTLTFTSFARAKRKQGFEPTVRILAVWLRGNQASLLAHLARPQGYGSAIVST